MTVFGAYARYYDLLYGEKDYAREADYVEGLLRAEDPDIHSILDLGCGTGLHGSLLASRGYDVVGIDQSGTMLELAERRRAELPEGVRERFRVEQGDIRSSRLAERFDAVISLFHVLSYQTTNDDIRATFESARGHLNPGGLFVFDCWYGPAVLTERPEVRSKSLENEELDVTRIAEPLMRPNLNLVDVNYRINIRDRVTGQDEELREVHTMRYFFLPEIRDFLHLTRFELVKAEEWLTGRTPGFETWNLCVVSRAM